MSGTGTTEQRHFAPFLSNLRASFSIDNKFWLFKVLGMSGTRPVPQASDTTAQADTSRAPTQQPGIGPGLAHAILADRAAHGPFRSAADLARVKGIGAATVRRLEAMAAERGIETTEFTYNLGGNGKSVILQTQGAAKVIAAANGAPGRPGPVLGVHLVGARVGELIAEGQLIYNWEALPSEVAQLIHPHPTQSEIIGEAHLALAGKPLHTHA